MKEIHRAALVLTVAAAWLINYLYVTNRDDDENNSLRCRQYHSSDHDGVHVAYVHPIELRGSVRIRDSSASAGKVNRTHPTALLWLNRLVVAYVQDHVIAVLINRSTMPIFDSDTDFLSRHSRNEWDMATILTAPGISLTKPKLTLLPMSTGVAIVAHGTRGETGESCTFVAVCNKSKCGKGGMREWEVMSPPVVHPRRLGDVTTLDLKWVGRRLYVLQKVRSCLWMRSVSVLGLLLRKSWTVRDQLPLGTPTRSKDVVIGTLDVGYALNGTHTRLSIYVLQFPYRKVLTAHLLVPSAMELEDLHKATLLNTSSPMWKPLTTMPDEHGSPALNLLHAFRLEFPMTPYHRHVAFVALQAKDVTFDTIYTDRSRVGTKICLLPLGMHGTVPVPVLPMHVLRRRGSLRSFQLFQLESGSERVLFVFEKELLGHSSVFIGELVLPSHGHHHA